MKTDTYQEVTDRIIAQLENGTIPWVKPWENHGELATPYNRQSKKAYRGINTLLLWIEQQLHGYSSSAWVTYKQAKELGGHVKKGSQSTKIIFFKPIEKTNDNGEKDSFMVARVYSVFNLDQCENIEPIARPTLIDHGQDSVILPVAQSVGANVEISGNSACFIPSADLIRMPKSGQFSTMAHFDATLAHELAHWTGHKSRLGRDLSGRFGSESYAAEELIAELSAAFISAEYGQCITELRHASYIESWLKVLKSDKRAIFTAASHAQKACDYIKESVLSVAA